MTPANYKELYLKELDNLHKEISAYTDEQQIWKISGDIKNPAGNLCLHLVGNINHFIGAVLGKNGYVRNRDAEFALKNIAKEKMLADITGAKQVVETVLGSMESEELDKDFPVELIGKKSTAYMLTYFHGHLMYHIGQINYHRRMI